MEFFLYFVGTLIFIGAFSVFIEWAFDRFW